MIIGPAIGQEKAKVENVIVWDLWSDQNYQKIPELKQLHEHNDVVPKGKKNTHSCINLSLRYYIENIGGCEPLQAAREELWECDWFSSLKPSILSGLTGLNHPEK